MATYGSLPAGYDRAGGYAHGGLLPEGQGWFHKTALEPERVLSPRQTVAFEGLVHALDRRVDGGFNLSRVEEPLSSQRTLALTQNIYGGSSEETAEKVVDNLAKVAW